MNKTTKLFAVALWGFTALAFGQQTTNPASEKTVEAQDVKKFSLQTKAIGGTEVTPNSTYVPGAGYVTSTWVDLGSSSTQDFILTITGLHLTTNSPAAISCQPRQNWNYDYGFSDQFACQVVTTAWDHMVVRVRRLDANGGWGQDLRLDLIIFDWVNN